MIEFFDYGNTDQLYNYKILVYPNITFQKALEKDSFIVVLTNTIKELNYMRNDIHFTVLVPHKTPSLDFYNVDQIIMPIPSYPPIMRTHFDFFTFNKLFDWDYTDFDIIYSHLPEHTLNLASFFSNYTNISPEYIGYCHWFEIDENSSYSDRMFLNNISGILRMKECGVNSIWLKDLISDKVMELFSRDILYKFRKIVQPHYLGIDSINTEDTKYEPKTILFNHRASSYTGWSWFIQTMDNLWKQRQDFKVYTTLENLDRPYLQRKKLPDRSSYIKFLKSIYIGVGCFEKYSAWSISTTDGLSQGVPYLLPKDYCYPEMLGNGYPLFYNGRNDFEMKLNDLLDNTDLRDKANDYIKPLLPDFQWSNRISKWFNGWDIFDLPEGQKNETYDKLIDYIRSRGEVTKKELIKFLGWGRNFSFTKHRNSLRQHPNIKLTKNAYIWKN